MNPAAANSIQLLMKSATFYVVGLGVAFVILAIVVHYLRAWFRGSDGPADQSDEIVKQMEELKLRGDLSDEEFRSIKGRIEGNKDSRPV